MSTALNPAFTIGSSRWLRDSGVWGKAAVRLAADGLEITGAEGGLLRLHTPQIRRLTTGWSSVKNGSYFRTAVLLEGREKPIHFEVHGLGQHDYAAAMRGLAAQLHAKDGLTRLWRGSSIAAALELVIPMTVLFIAALAIAIFALENEPWWGRLVPPLTALPFVILGGVIARLRWPRPVRSLEEFNRRVAPLPRTK